MSEDDLALIGTIKYNASRNREEGFNITGFKEHDKDMFFEIILNDWRSKLKIEFDVHIKWILNHGSNWSFKQILDIDYEFWLNSEEFNSWVNSNINKYKPETHNYIINKWSINKVIDATLEALFSSNVISLIDQVFNIRYDLIFDPGFEYKYLRLTNTNQEYLIDRVITKLNSSDSTIFIYHLDWISKYSKGKAIDKVMNIYGDFMAESDSIIEFITKKKDSL